MEIITVCVVTAVNNFAMGYMALSEAMRKLMSGLHLSKA